MRGPGFAPRVYLLALIARIIPVIAARGMGLGLDDMFQYDMLARSLAAGNGYRWYARADAARVAPYVDLDLAGAKGYDPERGLETTFRAPLYPAFLALVYLVFGSGEARFTAARAVQAVLLGAPLAPLTYFAARKYLALRASPLITTMEASRDESGARAAAIAIALYPILLLYALGLGTENLFFVLVLLSVILLLTAWTKPTPVVEMAAGLALGLSALTRSVILPFCLLAVLWLWRYVSWRAAGMSALALAAVTLPWVARNTRLHGQLTGIETSLGYNMYLGYHPQGDGSFVFGPSLDLLPILDDAERDRVGMAAAREFIRSRPDRLPGLAWNRLGFFFGLEKRAVVYFYSNNLVGHMDFIPLLILLILLLLPFVLLSLSAALGLALLRGRHPVDLLLALLFAACLLPHVLILAEDRFHLLLVPFMAMMGGVFWSQGARALLLRWKESSTGRLAVCTALVVCALLAANWGAELHRDSAKLGAVLGADGNRTSYPY